MARVLRRRKEMASEDLRLFDVVGGNSGSVYHPPPSPSVPTLPGARHQHHTGGRREKRQPHCSAISPHPPRASSPRHVQMSQRRLRKAIKARSPPKRRPAFLFAPPVEECPINDLLAGAGVEYNDEGPKSKWRKAKKWDVREDSLYGVNGLGAFGGASLMCRSRSALEWAQNRLENIASHQHEKQQPVRRYRATNFPHYSVPPPASFFSNKDCILKTLRADAFSHEDEDDGIEGGDNDDDCIAELQSLGFYKRGKAGGRDSLAMLGEYVELQRKEVIGVLERY